MPVFKTEPKAPGWYRKSRPFSGYIELFNKNDVDNLTKEGKRVYRYLFNKYDFNSQLKADIHNHKSKVIESGLGRLLNMFRENNLTTVDEVYDFLYNKWTDR